MNCKEPQKNLTFALPHSILLAHLLHSNRDVSLMRADSPSVLFPNVSPALITAPVLSVSYMLLEKSYVHLQS